MAKKKVSNIRLFRNSDLFEGRFRVAARGFIFSHQASGYFTPRTEEPHEFSLSLLADDAESQKWPGIAFITTQHFEAYLVYMRSSHRWFGLRCSENLKPVCSSTVETNYRRLKRFFNWLVERAFHDQNPFDLIKHPRMNDRIIPTVRLAIL